MSDSEESPTNASAGSTVVDSVSAVKSEPDGNRALVVGHPTVTMAMFNRLEPPTFMSEKKSYSAYKKDFGQESPVFHKLVRLRLWCMDWKDTRVVLKKRSS